MVQTIQPPSEKAAPFLMPDLTSLRLTAEQFEQVCRDNPDHASRANVNWRPDSHAARGFVNWQTELSILLDKSGAWAKNDGTGIAF